MAYAKERKEAVLKKMMPPHNVALSVLAEQEGISEGTLHLWRQEARRKGVLLPNAEHTPHGWTSKDKFAAVLETAALNEAERAEYCRKRGLYPEQLVLWRQACEQANDWREAQERQLKQQVKEQQKETQRLQKELARKEKALAEAAALLVLKKKWTHFGGTERKNDSARPTSSSRSMGYRSPKPRSALGGLLRSVGHLEKNMAALGARRRGVGRQETERETTDPREQTERRGERTSACRLP